MATSIVSFTKRLEQVITACDNGIKKLEVPRITNTPKRQREDMRRRIDASRLKRVRAAAMRLHGFAADGKEHELAAYKELLSTTALTHVFTTHIESRGYYHVCDSYEYIDQRPLAQLLRRYVGMEDARAGINMRLEELSQLEYEVRFAKIFDFFPTPASVVQEMLRHVDVNGRSVLEPSAGKGDIADAVREAGGRVTCVEHNTKLCQILRLKGHNTECADFLDWSVSSPKFDAIVMNPPFGNRADSRHVMAAYSLLKPGGKLAAIVSAGTMTDRRYVNFHDLLKETMIHSESQGQAFAKAFVQTFVSSHLIVLENNGYELLHRNMS